MVHVRLYGGIGHEQTAMRGQHNRRADDIGAAHNLVTDGGNGIGIIHHPDLYSMWEQFLVDSLYLPYY